MRVVVTGAGGFVGQRILHRLEDLPEVEAVCAVDRLKVPERGKITAFRGDFGDSALWGRMVDQADAIIHLAAVLGGAAEADPALARRVNIDATLNLIDRLCGSDVRFVFASTVAAYGKPLPDPVSDATPLSPVMLYGAQKVMIEVALSNHAKRGRLDAVSLRPSGVMARDGADAALKSAFMSKLFYCVQRGEDIVLPVAQDSRTWLASVESVARNFIHAAILPELGTTRAFTLPALTLSYGELVAALRRRFPDSPSTVRYEPNPETVALFGQSPELVTETADALGFSRDLDADALVRGAMKETS